MHLLQFLCTDYDLSVPLQDIQLDAAGSVSRIGGRALHPALRDLALSARLELVQALDADEFSATKNDPVNAAALERAQQLSAVLRQVPGSFVPLEEQVGKHHNLYFPARRHKIQHFSRRSSECGEGLLLVAYGKGIPYRYIQFG